MTIRPPRLPQMPSRKGMADLVLKLDVSILKKLVNKPSFKTADKLIGAVVQPHRIQSPVRVSGFPGKTSEALKPWLAGTGFLDCGSAGNAVGRPRVILHPLIAVPLRDCAPLWWLRRGRGGASLGENLAPRDGVSGFPGHVLRFHPKP